MAPKKAVLFCFTGVQQSQVGSCLSIVHRKEAHCRRNVLLHEAELALALVELLLTLLQFFALLTIMSLNKSHKELVVLAFQN